MVFARHAMPHAGIDVTFSWAPAKVVTALKGVEAAGGFGVDLFFLLSSYLITELLLRERRQRGTIDLRSFWIRRILRIWPLYFFFLLLSYFVIPRFLYQDFPWLHMAGFLTFTGNFTNAFLPGLVSVAGPLWSVSIEEQFYLTWPVILYFFPRGLKLFSYFLLVAATCGRAWLAYHHQPYSMFWYNTITHMDPIAVGALMAITLNGSVPRWSRRVRWAGIALGTGCLWFVGLFLRHSGWQALLTYPLVTFACAVLLLSVLREPGTRSNAALVYLGRVSYGLYVYHIFALTLVREYAPQLNMLTTAALALFLTTALAAASFKFIEQPFLRLKERFTYVRSRPE